MVLFVLGLIALTLVVYLVLRVLTSRRVEPTRRGPVAPPRPPDDDEDFLRDLRRRMKDPREE